MDFWSIALAVVLGGGLGWLMVRNQNTDFTKITVLNKDDFASNMRKGQLVDIRKKAEFEQDKIKGARNFKVGDMTQKYSKLRLDQAIYLYCSNGRKSKRAAKKLVRKGFKAVYVLEGGFNNYNN